MARYSIISKDGTSVRHIGYPRYSGSYMGVGVLEFSEISSPSPISWEIGDFVDYRNRIYRLYSLPEPKKQARKGEYGAAFVYTGVQFHSPVKELEIALFRDVVTEDNDVHFSTLPDVSTFENVYGIARRIQECMNDLYPNRWRIEVFQSNDEDLNTLLSEIKEFSLSGGTCFDALSLIYDTWKNVGWIHTTEGDKEVITIARANVRDGDNTTDSFAYGKGNGLTAIRRASANKEEFATRLYVYGSDRNMPPRYYNSKDIKDAESVNIPNLMLPINTWGETNGVRDPRLAYLEADEDIVRKYGLIPRVIRFDGSEREEIYPSIEGLTDTEVRQAMIEAGQTGKYMPGDYGVRIDEVVNFFIPGDNGNITKADGTPLTLERTFTLEVNTPGFDILAQAALAGESNARISMKSGKCAGREFIVKKAQWYGGTWVLTMERQLDDSLNMLFPNTDYHLMPGDRFVLLDIAMPEYYITLAQKRMYEEGMKVLADYTRTSAYYEPQIDSRIVTEHGLVIHEGMYMKVVDEDVVQTESKEDFVLIDSLSIDEKTEIPTYSATLREQKRAAKGLAALEGMIEDAKDNTGKEIMTQKQYTQRRFSSAMETISMLQNAFSNFSEGINPVTVQTIALLVGDESLQFKFTSLTSAAAIETPVIYDNNNGEIKITRECRIWHMTLGVDSVTAPSGRTDDDYLKWLMPIWSYSLPEDGSKAYYLYAKVEKEGTSGDYVLSEQPITMEAESGYYHLLVGVLNSEYDGTREFVPLYGFTEVLPGQITTDVIKSADGNSVLDLVKGLLTFGKFVGLSGHTVEGVNNLRVWAGTGESNNENAPFRVYDDGSVFASALQLLNGCKIGQGIRVQDDEIIIDLPENNARLRLGERGIAMEGDSSVIIGGCSGATIQGIANGAMVHCPVPRRYGAETIAFHGSTRSGDIVFLAEGGMFAGLRPMTRVISRSSSNSSSNRVILEDYNFSVLVNQTSDTCYLSLPTNPLDGQEYYIESKGAFLDITASQSVFSLYSGTTINAGTSITQPGTSLLRFKYYEAIGQWTVAWMNRNV